MSDPCGTHNPSLLSDQHLISPYNIIQELNIKVARKSEMITINFKEALDSSF